MVEVRKEIPQGWTPLNLLDMIARTAQDRQCYALIDTGALITGLENYEVAEKLLDGLPASTFDGVVYLDAEDRPCALLRASRRSVPLQRAALPWDRRFTFYDQVISRLVIRVHGHTAVAQDGPQRSPLEGHSHSSWWRRDREARAAFQQEVHPVVTANVSFFFLFVVESRAARRGMVHGKVGLRLPFPKFGAL